MYVEQHVTRASDARANGRHAVEQAIQHHIDRLQTNKTHSAFANVRPESVTPAYRGAISNAHVRNKAAEPRAFFTPEQNRQAHRMYNKNASPLQKLGDRAEKFLGLREFGKQTTEMFDPRTREGLVNIASMFAGGPKGDEMGGYDMRAPQRVMDKLGMKDQFAPYSIPAHRAAGHIVENEMQAPRFSEALSQQRFNRQAIKANDFLAKKANVGQGWDVMGPDAISGFKVNDLAMRRALYDMLFGKSNELFSELPIPRRP